jgi:ferric-dicitrate binding protein FerR (iron transport regulator)
MYEEIVRILYELVNRQAISDEDKRKLEEWISLSAHNRRLYEEVLDAEAFRQEVKTSLDLDSKQLWKKISKRLPRKKNNLIAFFRDRPLRYAVAAAVLLIFSTGVYFLFFNKAAKEIASVEKIEKRMNNDVEPGTDKAVLTVADGSTIILDNSKKGIITEQNGTTVTNEEMQLKYDVSGPKALNQPLSYHTLTTPRGGQYQLLLPDGSKVFLNAASSIHFPTAFIGDERNVEITGEAYFEVAKDSKKPFKVNVKGMQIEVLGTHFNINAYDDEQIIRTTLFEGIVKVSKNGNNKMIKPGQQAQVDPGNENVRITTADAEQTIAWKEGFFVFKNNDIETIMRQLARWYDVDVVYKGRPAEKFSGRINRNTKLSEVLKAFEESSVHFKIQNKSITVMP